MNVDIFVMTQVAELIFCLFVRKQFFLIKGLRLYLIHSLMEFWTQAQVN